MYADEKIRTEIYKQLKEKSLDDLNVRMICDGAGVKRQTFYYYYKDLLGAIRSELGPKYIDCMGDSASAQTWSIGLLKTLRFVKEHADIVNHLYFSSSKDQILKDIETYASQVFAIHVHDLAVQHHYKLRITDEDFLVQFYVTTFISMICSFIEKGMVENPDTLVLRMVTVMEGSILRSMKALEKIDSNMKVNQYNECNLA